jgi:hypothetical protein
MSDDGVNRQTYSTPNAAGSKAPDNTEYPIQFLEQLRPNGPWVLTAIVPDGSTDTITVYSSAEVHAFAMKHNGNSRNIYYSVNPTREPVFKKAAKTDIAAIEYLLADLDPKEGENSADAKVRYLEQLKTFEPMPTAIVDSGNGIQCLWRLDQRIVLGTPVQTTDEKGKTKLVFSPEDQAKIKDAEDRTAAIMIRLGAKAGTQNVDRILRLPGTTNFPNAKKLKEGRKPCPSSLLAFNEVSYPLELFVPATPDDGGHHARQEDQGQQKESTDAHEAVGDRLERIIRDGPRPDEFNSKRSGAVWWAINEMLRNGYLDRAIVSTLLDHANKISAHIYDQPQPRAYAERQIAKAREKNPPPKVKVLPESQWFGEKQIPPPPALIKGILPQTGVATIGGQSGAGKSFQAIHLGVRLIPDCNQHFYIDRYPIKRQGGVLYLVLEGKPSFAIRVTAAFEELLDKQLKFGDRARLPFAWNTYAPNLFEKGPDALLKLADREAQKMRREFAVDLVAVMLDTMGLAACYENENMAAQVQRVVSGLNRLSDETGALAVNVDHMGKDQDAGMRGTSAKRDCVETILACLIDRDRDNRPINHRMQLFKIRDGEEGRVIPYRLKPIDMGRDEDGDPVSTCVVQWEMDRPQQTKQRKTPKEKTDVVLELAIKEVGLPADYEELRTVFYRLHGGNNKAANTAWHRAMGRRGLAVDKDGRVYEPF